MNSINAAVAPSTSEHTNPQQPPILIDDERVRLMRAWLGTLPESLGLQLNSLSVASADASFRRYFRVCSAAGESYIVMDAPPAHEDVRLFVLVARLFGGAGVNVPAIVHEDEAQGFLLLSDFGNDTLLSSLAQQPQQASAWYAEAARQLIQLQLGTDAQALPPYNRERLLQEMMLFPEWYIGVHHGYSLSDEQTAQLGRVFDVLLANNTAQGQVWVHRDYHSRNLMVAPTAMGVLDFQDALVGPITYDLVSLLRDAYVHWEEEVQIDRLARYWQDARAAGLPVPDAFDAFYLDYEYMGLQRHLKILGIFARLYHRDGKAGYLANLPLVVHYVRKVAARYRDFAPLVRLLDAVAQQTERDDLVETTQVGFTF